jgi:hypothetical protein
MREDKLEEIEREEIKSVADDMLSLMEGISVNIGINATVYLLKLMINDFVTEKVEVCETMVEEFTSLRKMYEDKSGKRNAS